MKIKLITFICLIFISINYQEVYAESLPTIKLHYKIVNNWGTPTRAAYKSINETVTLTYHKKHATLIISESKCPKCKQVTQDEIKQINANTKSGIVALFIHVNNNSASYQLYSSPKGVDSRLVRFMNNGLYYEIQLTINKEIMKSNYLEYEREFIKLINSIK